MKIATVTEAIHEAERFIAAATVALLAQTASQILFDLSFPNSGRHEVWDTCQENATCKRASMDLTRALARMRKP